MKMDKTRRMMAAGDSCEFSNCSLFHHIKLSSPNLQTRRNRPGASAEWATVSKNQLDACYRKGFCCRSSTFQNAWVLQNEQIVPSIFPVPIFSHLTLFIPPRWSGRRRSARENSLSDERDKWWGCFGSGDSVAGKTECTREGDKNREWSDETTEGDRCQLSGDFRHDTQPSCLSDAQTMTSVQWAESHVVHMTHKVITSSIRGPLCQRCLLLDIVLFRLIQ